MDANEPPGDITAQLLTIARQRKEYTQKRDVLLIDIAHVDNLIRECEDRARVLLDRAKKQGPASLRPIEIKTSTDLSGHKRSQVIYDQ